MRVRMIERATQETIECRFLTDEGLGMSTGFRLGRPAWSLPYTPEIREAREFSSSHNRGVAPGSGFLDAATGSWIGSSSSMSTWGRNKLRLLAAIGLRAGGSRSKRSRPADKSAY